MKNFIKKSIALLSIVSLLCFTSRAYAATNNSAVFDGTSTNRLESTNNFTQYGAAAITIEFWIKGGSQNATEFPFSLNDNSASTFEFEKGNFDTDYVWRINTVASGGTSPHILATALETSSWHHVAVTYDGANIHIYLDTVEQGTGTALTGNIKTANPSKFSIGARKVGTFPWTGNISEVRIYNVARTQAAIASDYNQLLVGNESGLTAYWSLNNTSADSTSNANNLVGTRINSTDGPISPASASPKQFQTAGSFIQTGGIIINK